MALPIVQKAKDALSSAPDPGKLPIPPDVGPKVERAQQRIRQGAAMRNLCMRFYRNQQYWYLDENGVLSAQATVTGLNGGGKPRHRVRTTRNWVTPIVNAKVSQSTQRIPSYEAVPSSFDADRVSAASLAEKVAVYGYDKWRVQRVTQKAVTLALVADESFAWPFWDSTVGPFAQTELGTIGLGEVAIRVLSRNEVGWEPGMDFEDSPYYIVTQARPVDEVEQIDGYLGGVLTPDANSDQSLSRKRQQAQKLVLVTDYLERPSAKFPNGRWLTMANKRLIAGIDLTGDAPQPRQYPLTGCDGQVCDEPVLHRLSYMVDPDSDEDLGLVRFLVDAQRTYNDIWNKSLEWKNRCLNPRILAPVNSMKTRPDDTPGGIDYYVPVGGQVPQWEKPPEVPQSLQWLMQETRNDMQQIAQAAVPNDDLSGDNFQAHIDQSQLQWQDFLAKLAEWHSRVMRHCLMLVSQHYSEPRMLSVRGRTSWESIQSFQGADLLGEIDVRVLPGSLATLTRDEIMKRLQFLTAAFPGAISVEAAMAAMQGGTAEQLIASYELDVARANRMVQRICSGPEVFLSEPFDQNNPLADPPSWMPREWDSVPVHKQVFSDYMKSDAYDMDPPEVQEAFKLYWQGLDWLEQQQQIKQQVQQNMMAENLGMQNAASPQQGKPMPNTPAPYGSRGQAQAGK